MKSVLISIQPKWVEKICHQIGEENGKPVYEKRIEVRKSKPSCEVPFKCDIYESRNGGHRCKHCNKKDDCYSYAPKNVGCYNGKGKVIGYFVCDKIDTYYYGNMDYPIPKFEGDDSVYKVGDGYYITSGELEETCLTYEELEDYGKGKTLYGWHISDLVIYDKPRELSEFYRPCSYSGICYSCNRFRPNGTPNDKPNDFCDSTITRPPQSWCYIEEVEE